MPVQSTKSKRRGHSRALPHAGGTAADPNAVSAVDFSYKIVGGPAFSEVHVTLLPGQAVVADASALQYMKGSVEHAGLKTGGIFSAVGRFFSDEGVFLNKYAAPHGAARGGVVSFASPFPGDALALRMSPGEEWTLSRGGYLASTANITISGKLNWRGILPFGQDEGMVLPKITCEGPSGGIAFVSAYGGYEKHDLSAGERLLVNNGLFLACRADVQYTIEQLGKSFLSSFLGGEGLGMCFVGPCTVYTQSRNFTDLVAEIASKLPDSGAETSYHLEIGGGGRAPPARRPRQPKAPPKAQPMSNW